MLRGSARHKSPRGSPPLGQTGESPAEREGSPRRLHALVLVLSISVGRSVDAGYVDSDDATMRRFNRIETRSTVIV